MATTILNVPTSKNVSQIHNSLSPYDENNLVLLSRVTEKTVLQKGSTFRSTSNNVYKANSDHLDTIYAKSNKKSKKSVLTLPNEPDLMPQECTVSDINDSDYFKKDDEQRNWRSKCRFPVRYNKNAKQRIAKTDYQNTVWKSPAFKGDEKKNTCKTAAHEVWALLRNMNRFQYQTSPPMSDDSFEFKKQKPIIPKKRNTRYFETCHTEEIEYTITSYDLDKQFSKNPPTRSRVKQNGNSNEESNDGYKAPEITKEKDENKISNYSSDDMNKMNIQTYNEPSFKNCLIEMKKGSSNSANMENHEENTIIPVISSETLKNPDSNSNTTLTQSLEISSIGTATSSKFYSNAEKPNLTLKEQQNVVRKYKSNIIKRNIAESGRKNKIDKNLRTMNSSTKFDSNKIRNKNNEFTASPNSSKTMNAAKKTPSVAVTRTNENFKSYDMLPSTTTTTSTCVLPASEGRRENKFRDATINTKKIYDIYRGELDQVSSEELKSKNILRKPEKVDVREIRRMLANMRFPVMITGRDQTSTIKIANSQFSQFTGLDTQIWPFMSEWLDIKKFKPNSRKSKTCNNASQVSEQCEQRITKKKKIDENQSKCKSEQNNIIFEKEKCTNQKSYQFESKGKNDLRLNSDISCIDQQKAIKFNNFKNKVKKLLGKKSTNTIGTTTTHSDQAELIESRELELQQPMTKIVIKNKRDQNVNVVSINENNLNYNRKKYSCPRIVGKQTSTSGFQKTSQTKIEHKDYKNKRVRSKAKWANDVIDNVLKKMKNGFYYMQQAQPTKPEKECDLIIPIIHDESSTSVTFEDFNNSIPGFDEPLPALEVETLSMNEISIKQCVTNLIIRFDVIIPNTKNAQTLSKIKCQPETSSALPGILNWHTTILNTILPAELCSVIPKMMRKFSEISLKFPLPSVKLAKTEPQLATIAEISRYESSILSLLPTLGMSSNVSKFWNCMTTFMMNFHRDLHSGNVGIGGSRVNCDLTDVSLVLPKTTMRIPCNVEIPFTIITNFQQHTPSQQLGEKNVSNTHLSTNANNLAVSTIMKFDLIEILNTLIEYRNILTIKTDVSFKSGKITEIAQKIHDNICNNFLIRTPRMTKKEIMLFSSRRSFCIRNYNVMCTSTRNDLNCKQEGKNYASLYTITNLEEFIQILGSGPALSSVFDEKAGKKIMSCIFKMRKWVAEIDSNQAMLIILLINKYNSQDLVKYGAKLLQGIAENKITNTSEIQKEIDALKQRKLEYERNQAILFKKPEKEDLFQELYWIAKTAANHSNGNFDVNVEEKLRRFLERRTQLNPSFLRAMATYLGLGLLTVDLEERRKVDK